MQSIGAEGVIFGGVGLFFVFLFLLVPFIIWLLLRPDKETHYR